MAHFFETSSFVRHLKGISVAYLAKTVCHGFSIGHFKALSFPLSRKARNPRTDPRLIHAGTRIGIEKKLKSLCHDGFKQNGMFTRLVEIRTGYPLARVNGRKEIRRFYVGARYAVPLQSVCIGTSPEISFSSNLFPTVISVLG